MSDILDSKTLRELGVHSHEDLMKFVGLKDVTWPIAFYCENLDMVCVELRDCSYTEHGINKIASVLIANHYKDTSDSGLVGFCVYGVKHFLTENYITRFYGHRKISEIIDLMAMEHKQMLGKYKKKIETTLKEYDLVVYIP